MRIRPTPSRCARVRPLLVACVVLVLGVTACTDEAPAPRPGAKPSESPPATVAGRRTLDAEPVPLRVRVGPVAGSLGKRQRAAVDEQVGKVVSRYVDAALTGGDYPRTDFRGAFRSFTRNAAAQARRQRDLLTSSGVAGSVESIRVLAKRARVSVLAPGGDPAGATAHLRVVYVANRDGRPDLRVRMTGRLMLRPGGEAGWRIFGYDVAQSVVPQKGARR